MSIIQRIRQKVLNEEYEFTIPHFFEEMANDGLVFPDIKNAVFKGRIRGKFTRDPRAGHVTRLLGLQLTVENLQLYVASKALVNCYLSLRMLR